MHFTLTLLAGIALALVAGFLYAFGVDQGYDHQAVLYGVGSVLAIGGSAPLIQTEDATSKVRFGLVVGLGTSVLIAAPITSPAASVPLVAAFLFVAALSFGINARLKDAMGWSKRSVAGWWFVFLLVTAAMETVLLAPFLFGTDKSLSSILSLIVGIGYFLALVVGALLDLKLWSDAEAPVHRSARSRGDHLREARSRRPDSKTTKTTIVCGR